MFWKYVLISKILGLAFGLKLMERGEEAAQDNYKKISKHIKKDAEKIKRDEQRHERELLEMLDEERLKYVGSIVLGLNDALVELTGALAGLTLALQNSQLIATAGLVTGIAASMSMGASEYLSTRSEVISKEDTSKSSISLELKNQESKIPEKLLGVFDKDKDGKSPIKASVYTGLAYIITVFF